MTPQEDIRQFLELRARARGEVPPGYKETPESLLLKYGRQYPITESTFAGKRRQAKMCYMNAANLAIGNDELTYVEGYAHMGILPIHHAWVVDQQGNVIDPTLRDATGYFGIPIQTDYLRATLLRTGYYGVLDGMTNRQIYKDEPSKFVAA